MKKYLAVMMFGMASGVAGSYIVYTECKNGNIPKMLDNVTDKAKQTVQKMK